MLPMSFVGSVPQLWSRREINHMMKVGQRSTLIRPLRPVNTQKQVAIFLLTEKFPRDTLMRVNDLQLTGAI
jgi:hypothetical protein